jgi:hypothetical protein
VVTSLGISGMSTRSVKRLEAAGIDTILTDRSRTGSGPSFVLPLAFNEDRFLPRFFSVSESRPFLVRCFPTFDHFPPQTRQQPECVWNSVRTHCSLQLPDGCLASPRHCFLASPLRYRFR